MTPTQEDHEAAARLNVFWWLCRAFMRLAHRFNWHYAPPCYPDGDTQLWCRWCGFRQTIAKASR